MGLRLSDKVRCRALSYNTNMASMVGLNMVKLNSKGSRGLFSYFKKYNPIDLPLTHELPAIKQIIRER